jgi:hypothetical protein
MKLGKGPSITGRGRAYLRPRGIFDHSFLETPFWEARLW